MTAFDYAVSHTYKGALEVKIDSEKLHNAWAYVVEAMPGSAWVDVLNSLALVTDEPTDATDPLTGDSYGLCVPSGDLFKVYLSPLLVREGPDFIRSAIAHELGHVYAGGGTGNTEDDERAADTAARSWGFQSDGLRRHRLEQYRKGFRR